MKFAWIEDGKVRDVCPGDPASSYTPDIAAHYTAQVPDDAGNGDGWDGATLTPMVRPKPLPPAPPPPVVLSRVQFKLLLTPAERIAVRKSTDPGVQDWYEILQDPQFEGVVLGGGATERAMAYLEAQGILTAGRKAAILAGEEP